MILPPSGSCQQILLSPVSPAIYRVATAGLGNVTLASASWTTCSPPSSGNGSTAQFMVRLLDDTGHSQYLATCRRADVAGIDTTGQPYVWIDAVEHAHPDGAADAAGRGGISGFARRARLGQPRADRPLGDHVDDPRRPRAGAVRERPGEHRPGHGQVDPNKYDLVRSYVDAKPATSSRRRPRSWPSTRSTSTSPSPSTIGHTTGTPDAQPRHLRLRRRADNASLGRRRVDVTAAGHRRPSRQGPQRIRSVRARDRDPRGAARSHRATSRCRPYSHRGVHVPLLHARRAAAPAATPATSAVGARPHPHDRGRPPQQLRGVTSTDDHAPHSLAKRRCARAAATRRARRCSSCR